jgi:hypothetical protein
MDDVVMSGDVEEVPKGESPKWFVPHHCVMHPKKGKLRVVLDCSARFRGTSINNNLLQGPDQMNSFIGVLCRFREEEVAISKGCFIDLDVS